jgi:hypothetical protein
MNHKEITKERLLGYLEEFINIEKEVDELRIVNKYDFDREHFNDIDYYFNSFFGCIYCKSILNTFYSLFLHMYFEHPVDVYHYLYLNKEGIEERHLFSVEADIPIDERINSFYELVLGLKNFTYTNYKRLCLPNIKNSRKFMKEYLMDLYILQYVGNVVDKPFLRSEPRYKVVGELTAERKYFHSVTGKVRDENTDDVDYEVSQTERAELLEDNINEYADICEEDKQLFILWNRFVINEGDMRKRDYKDACKRFIDENSGKLGELRDCLMLHLLTMYDQRKLNGDELKECIEYASSKF